MPSKDSLSRVDRTQRFSVEIVERAGRRHRHHSHSAISESRPSPIERLPIIIAGLNGIGHKDVIKDMLAVRILACHHASMNRFRRAAIRSERPEG